jgi:cystathionine gamma-synthase
MESIIMAKSSGKAKAPRGGKSLSTRSIHAGEPREKYYDSLTTPVCQTSTYSYKNVKEIEDFTKRHKERFEYGRYGNPAAKVAENRLADLEGAEDCIVFASGMNAITTAILTFVKPGDHLIITDDCYRRTRRFCIEYLKQFGVRCSFVPFGNYRALERAIRKNTRIIFSESPTNPYLKVLDFDRIVKIAKRHKILTFIDSTFSTPLNCRPLEYGIDLVLQSATKYIAGHNDILAGAALGRKKLLEPIRELHKTLGGIIDPYGCYLLIRGLKTFALRVERQNNSTLEIARFLEKHPQIKTVYYPFLESHPYHELAKKQMTGGGGIVTFEIKANLSAAKKFLDALKMISIAPSLGGVETIITHPAIVNYYHYTRKQRYQIGITDGLFRLAVGIEDVDDIVKDIKRGLKY